MSCVAKYNVFGMPLPGPCPDYYGHTYSLPHHREVCAGAPETCMAHERVDEFDAYCREVLGDQKVEVP